MPPPIELESEEREFFGMLEQAAFSNPFGDRRGDIDRRSVEAPDGWSRPRLLEELVKRVATRVPSPRGAQGTARPPFPHGRLAGDEHVRKWPESASTRDTPST